MTRGMALAIWVPVGLVFRAAARAAPLAVASDRDVPRGDQEEEGGVVESVRHVMLTATPQAGAGRVSPGDDQELLPPRWRRVTVRRMLRRKASAMAAVGRARRHGMAGTRVEPETRIRAEHGRIVVGDGVQLRRGCHIAVVGRSDLPATLTLGEDVIVGARTRINVSEAVSIGDHTEVSWLVRIMDTDFHRITELDGTVRPHQAPVVMDSHVLIGTGAIITKGVAIGNGAVVGAGSVVTSDVKPGSLVGGNPARFVREIRN